MAFRLLVDRTALVNESNVSLVEPSANFRMVIYEREFSKNYKGVGKFVSISFFKIC